MRPMILWLLMCLYVLCALLLALYTSGQLVLLVQYAKRRNESPQLPLVTEWATVTIQLPIYNEQYVIGRLLTAIAHLDYPREKLTVQVLDDSDDETSIVVAAQVKRLQATGLDIHHIRREKRTGYKAGALAYGMTLVDSDLIAIFDADFIPPSDFLKQTVPHLQANPQIGVVQTRWGHLNADANGLTQAQMLAIDAHFVVEQTARNRAGWLIPFNGTGGVWRRACIQDAGGWSDETLTEDLDLSYWAQLAGWQSLFLPDVVVPGELPPQLEAYKQQQARWATGNTQCLIRLMGPVWRSSLTVLQRIMAIQHLCQYLPHPLMLALLLLTPPLLISEFMSSLTFLAPLGLVGLAPPMLYVVSQRKLYADWKRHLLAFPALLLIGTGITWNNTRAVWHALHSKNNTFKRTPKFATDWTSNRYALQGDSSIVVEGLLAAYAFWGVSLALRIQPAIAPYLLIYGVSFLTMALWGMRERWSLRQQRRALQLQG